MTERTVTIPTLDRGDLTTVCPPWCNTEMHQPGGYSVDITHITDDTEITVRIGDDETPLLLVVLEQTPFSDKPPGTDPFISVGINNDWWPATPAGLNQLADNLTQTGEQLRRAADHFAPHVTDDRTPAGPGTVLADMARRLVEQVTAGRAPWDGITPEGGSRQATREQAIGPYVVRLSAAILTGGEGQ